MSRVGENIDAHCLKCKLVLAHIVMYEVGGQVSKVKCKTCGAEHKYRGVKPPPKKGEPSERAVREKKARAAAGKTPFNSAPIEWEARHQNMDPDQPTRDYTLQAVYEAGDVIRHPVFGLGFVLRIISEKRMDVLFNEAVKTMAMNMP